MLEEALASPAFPPPEAALALLSFLGYELPAGGSAAEARFLRLFPALCARAFGEVDPRDGFRYGVGGWLGRREPWGAEGGGGGGGGGGTQSRSGGGSGSGPAAPRLGSSVGGSGSNSGAGGGLESDPVVQLLSGAPPGDGIDRRRGRGSSGDWGVAGGPGLLDAISAEAERRPGVRFAFPLQALPLPTQRALLALMDPNLASDPAAAAEVGAGAAASRRENALRLLGGVLRANPAEQADLRYALQARWRLLQQQRQMLARGRWGGHGGGSGSPPRGAFQSSLSPGAMGFGTDPLSPSGRAVPPLIPLPYDVRATLTLGMLEYYLVHFVRFPLAAPSSSPSPSPSPSPGQPHPSARARTPSTPAPPAPQQGGQDQTFQTLAPSRRTSSDAARAQAPNTAPARYYRRSGNGRYDRPHGEVVYAHLFRSYLRRYLPHDYFYHHRFASMGAAADAGSATSATFGLGLDRDSELFLRLLVEFWLEGDNIPPPASDALRLLRPRLIAADGTPDLDSSADLARAIPPQLGGLPYRPPPALVARCVRLLVVHLVSDPALRGAVRREGRERRERRDASPPPPPPPREARPSSVGGPSLPPGGRSGGSPAPQSATGHGHGLGEWRLTPAATAVQAPLFNYVRMALRHGPVHVSESPFYSALGAWLIWLEPWNVVQRRRPSGANFTPATAKDYILDTVSSTVAKVQHHDVGDGDGDGPSSSRTYSVVTIPKPTSSSKYSDSWEPYVASNLYLFVVPLAIFLRRARELDFGPREFRRSLSHVQRVLRVFTPDLVSLLDDLLADDAADPSLSSLVRGHERVLGEFCPPLPGWRDAESGVPSLSSLRGDMHDLLEEMYLQHRKRVLELDLLDRIAASIGGIGGHGVRGDEAALGRISARARTIVKFPEDYEVLPSDADDGGGRGGRAVGRLVGGRGGDDGAAAAPERAGGGFLTDRGREQILRGSRKCSALDIAFVGDPMYARVRTYEIPLLVTLTVWASDRLNQRLGLVPVPNDEEEEDEGAEGTEGVDDSTKLLLRHLREGQESQRIWFRINLRFLADYRNLLFVVLVAVLSKPFR